jgi:hypothetical protein
MKKMRHLRRVILNPRPARPRRKNKIKRMWLKMESEGGRRLSSWLLSRHGTRKSRLPT